MSPERTVNVSEPEMDMNRAVAQRSRFGMWRLFGVLEWLSPRIYAIENPRRSVDRELEEFSSPWE